ncbi:Y-family DNA polymerase [Bacillus sp. FJAT-44742]|uniref:Y-family DNA polymerase n=1 Tax=Bacillus sp. FJAT-44742 TaxID=2014005 RepID=UPI000C235952|nr:UV damage repair protein UvrX [Bacillus sp. FJAT-44742]
MDTLYSQIKRKTILCIDMKSFYASCSAIDLGHDPLTCCLAVVADTKRSGSVVLAATPAMKKKFGIKTGSRLFEIPDDPDIQIVNASMSAYLKTSVELTKFFAEFVPSAHIHTYSVDESFLQVDGSLHLYDSPRHMARMIQRSMLRRFGLMCAIGIGPNMLLSKLCLDLDAKKKGIAEWQFEDVKEKLWPVEPLSKMWGIGSRMERNLNRLGIRTVGQLARTPIELLEKQFGVMGSQLYHHAWGIDLSEIGAPILDGQISYGKSQILLRDYEKEEEIKHVILEMSEEVARRARRERKAGRTISLGVGYSHKEAGGFNRSYTVSEPTNETKEIYHICLHLFQKHYRGETVRSLSVTLSKVCEDSCTQLSLFDPKKPKRKALGYVMDQVRAKHGADSLLRAVSYTKAGTARHRSTLVGGHKAEG